MSQTMLRLLKQIFNENGENPPFCTVKLKQEKQEETQFWLEVDWKKISVFSCFIFYRKQSVPSIS